MLRSILFAGLAAGTLVSLAPAADAASDCPNGGTVRFGVEPYDASAKLVPIYDHIADLISKKLDCKVEVFIATNYNAEIEAMRKRQARVRRVRAARLRAGPSGREGRGRRHVRRQGRQSRKLHGRHRHLAGLGRDQARRMCAARASPISDPASTSGHLFPAYWLSKNGIDPEKDVKGFYAGSHAASYEALVNHKAQAGELNSEQIASATLSNHYNAERLRRVVALRPDPQRPDRGARRLARGFQGTPNQRASDARSQRLA